MAGGDLVVVVAAILAGGKSRRMGQDKAFVKIDGVFMIEKVLDVITPLVSQTVIIANEPEAYQRFSLPVYADIIVGMGPLSGLYTAFEKTGAEKILLVACDMPHINSDIVRYLIEYDEWEEEALIPFVGGREQGLLALYKRSAIEKVAGDISQKAIQFDQFRKVISKRLIAEEELEKIEPSLKTFDNINSQEDIGRL